MVSEPLIFAWKRYPRPIDCNHRRPFDPRMCALEEQARNASMHCITCIAIVALVGLSWLYDIGHGMKIAMGLWLTGIFSIAKFRNDYACYACGMWEWSRDVKNPAS
jgi:hypothetical protein